MCRREAVVVKNKTNLILAITGSVLMFLASRLLVYFLQTVRLDFAHDWITILWYCISLYSIGVFLGLSMSLIVYACAKMEIKQEHTE